MARARQSTDINEALQSLQRAMENQQFGGVLVLATCKDHPEKIYTISSDMGRIEKIAALEIVKHRLMTEVEDKSWYTG